MEKSLQRAKDIAQRNKNPTIDERKAMVLHEKQAKIDEYQINSTYKEKEMYLEMAIK